MKIKRILVLALFIITLSGRTVWCSDIYVNRFTGDDTFSGESWDTAKATIGAAIDTAGRDDVIRISEGIYRETLILNSHMTLVGGYRMDGLKWSPTEYQTILDAESTGRNILLADFTRVEGLRIRNGFTDNGGGGLSGYSVQAEVVSCHFENCMAAVDLPYGGGAAYVSYSTVEFRDCTFENNRLIPSGSGSETRYLNGGALYSWNSDTLVNHCRFDNNGGDYTDPLNMVKGGAIFVIGGDIRVISSEFENNFATYAGALGWWNYATGHVDDCRFTNNYARTGAGAIMVIFSEAEPQPGWNIIRNTSFEHNTSLDASAMLLLRNSRTRITNCRITENFSEHRGAGIYVAFDSRVDARNLTLADNYLTQSDASNGAAIYIGDGGELNLVNSIVAGNHPAEAVFVHENVTDDDVSITFCDFHGNTDDITGYGIDITRQGYNMFNDPVFVDGYCLSEPSTGDADQAAAGRSPCIDAGDTGTGTDYLSAGSTRTDGGVDQGIMDMGYHDLTRIPFVIDPYPAPGQSNLPQDITLSFTVLDFQDDLIPESVTLLVNGSERPVNIVPVVNGVNVACDTSEKFRHCETVSVEIRGRDRENNAISNGEYTFLISGCSQAEIMPIDLKLHLNQDLFLTGHRLYLTCDTKNMTNDFKVGDMYCLLEAAGVFFFYPTWSDQVQSHELRLDGNEFVRTDIIDIPELPDVNSGGNTFYFYAAVTEPGTFSFMSDPGVSAFRFQ